MDIYEQALVDLNLAEWPSLRAKLCPENDEKDEKDELLERLAKYVESCQVKQRADDAFNAYLDHPLYTSIEEHWAYMDRLREECEEAFRLSDLRLEEVNALL
jgi:hypothetical protein